MEHPSTTATDLPKWSALLIEAVTKPGLIMKAYSAFHTFSVGNQILALVQCQMRGLQPGPLNTFPKIAKRPQLLKVSDVAQLLNVKPRTIYEMVAQDRIPYRKPPGSNILRFDLDEILAWTKARTNT